MRVSRMCEVALVPRTSCGETSSGIGATRSLESPLWIQTMHQIAAAAIAPAMPNANIFRQFTRSALRRDVACDAGTSARRRYSSPGGIGGGGRLASRSISSCSSRSFIFSLEHSSQLPERFAHPPLDRACGLVEHLAHLAIAQALQVMQDQHLARLSRHSTHRVMQRPRRLIHQELIHGLTRVALFGHASFILSRSRSHRIHKSPVRYPMQPRPNRAIAVESIERVPRGGEGLLAQILGVVGVPCQVTSIR